MRERARTDRRRTRHAFAALGLACLAAASFVPWPGRASAQPIAAGAVEIGPDVADKTSGRPPSSIATSLPNDGDPYGTRRALAARGITFLSIYTGDLLSSVSGGRKRGTVYNGKLEIDVTADLGKLLGLDDLTFYVNGFQIHPTRGISRSFVGNLNTIDSNEALPATRLSELWLERKMLGDTVSLRVGQLAADSEFAIATYSLPFLTSDWPAIFKANMPNGGPAYPLATPGIRLKLDPSPNVSILGAVFNGDPAGPGFFGEVTNRTGTNFRLRDPALVMNELQVRYNQGEQDAGLAGTMKFGGWSHLGRFDDQRFDVLGGSLASPAALGPARLRGNGGLYATVDQQLYRPPGGDPDSGIATWARASFSPSSRNLVGFFMDGGLVFSGMVPSRPRDKFGATFLYTQLTRDAAAIDREMAVMAGLYRPISHSELSLELTYVAQIREGWTVQPNVQYVIRPNAGRIRSDTAILSPPLKDATILGLRTTIVY